MNMIPRLAITTGEPSGIGPDLLIKLASKEQSYQEKAQLVVIADKQMMFERAEHLGIHILFIDFEANEEILLALMQLFLAN